MDIAGLFLRVLDNNGDIYSPYSFEGNWSLDEKKIISGIIDLHVPEKVDAMFNNWNFHKVDSHYFMAKRATWESIWCRNSLTEIAELLDKYYNK